MDINTDAPVITRDEIHISADIQAVWDIQTNVTDWPSWQPDVDGAESEGPPSPSDRCFVGRRPVSTSHPRWKR